MSNTEIKNAVTNGKNNIPQLIKYVFLVSILFINLACNLVQLPQRQNPSEVSSEENISEQSAESLVVRSPTEWFPDPNSLEIFNDTPFQETWSRTNEEDAKSWHFEEDILGLYIKNKRIGGSAYWWDTNCQYDENIAISSGLVDIHLFRTSEGANNFFDALPNITINTFNRFNPDMKVTPMTIQEKIGDESFLYVVPLPSCTGFEVKNMFLVFRNMNVVSKIGLSSLDLIQDGQLREVISEEQLQSSLIELGNYLDNLIVEEANQKFAMPTEDSLDENTEIPSGDPLSFLSYDLECNPQGDGYTVSGYILNEGARNVQLEMVLIVYENYDVSSETRNSVKLEPGVEMPISFSGGYIPDPYQFAPPDDPFTEEYEPDVWVESMGPLPSYSCELKMVAQWDN